MAEIIASAKSTILSSFNAAYATAHLTCNSFNDTATFCSVGQKFWNPNYTVYRAVMKFDTSAIATNQIVSQVNLRLVLEADYSDTDFDVQIVKYDWSGSDPVTDVNRDTVFDGVLAATADDSIWKNTSGLAIDTPYTSGSLNTDWINKGGTTYYALRSSRDKAATTPTDSERVWIMNERHGTAAWHATLIVEYDLALGLYFFT